VVVALASRFCDGCYADAAKDMARQIEASLIASGFAVRSQKLRDALVREAGMRPLDWFVRSSILGEIRATEANYLRDLTETACLMLARGGVVALASLPGTRRLDRPVLVQGKCDLSALPQYAATEPKATTWRAEMAEQERNYQVYCAAVLLAMLVLVLLPAVRL
jgi:hypothetical protein